MTRTPQPDVDAISDDPTVLLERPGEDAFASVALPRPALPSAVAAQAPAPPPSTATAPNPSSTAGAPPASARPAAAVATVAERIAPDDAPPAATAAKRVKKRWAFDRLTKGAIVVACACALGAGWLIWRLIGA